MLSPVDGEGPWLAVVTPAKVFVLRAELEKAFWMLRLIELRSKTILIFADAEVRPN